MGKSADNFDLLSFLDRRSFRRLLISSSFFFPNKCCQNQSEVTSLLASWSLLDSP
ncbi:hypothetical protein AG1IA_08853 [Rhizoctonia solani AG-1 IA]|uniref:Uncharacterized protein n=1 Tax=Thanatephorus cucumeris (strain AG1-IA) TaxID=983506 RepID=L8WFZ5_THACA|nr:hypothetical protein AG1IA_08853 [Rhizoctonia solani AG-1 IA]